MPNSNYLMRWCGKRSPEARIGVMSPASDRQLPILSTDTYSVALPHPSDSDNQFW